MERTLVDAHCVFDALKPRLQALMNLIGVSQDVAQPESGRTVEAEKKAFADLQGFIEKEKLQEKPEMVTICWFVLVC
jgi:hypothetical protein